MTLFRTAVCCLALPAMLLCSPSSYGQFNRCILSFNPFGLLEPKGAIGLGVGYAFSPRWELWSETSRLQHIVWGGHSSGIREILQLKYFPPYRNPNFFIAAELRYKGFQYSDEQLTRHYRWWGTALQAGMREPINKKHGLYLEVTVGIGFRHIMYDKTDGLPPGVPAHNSGELLNMELIPMYYPGSIRLVWMFGKKL